MCDLLSFYYGHRLEIIERPSNIVGIVRPEADIVPAAAPIADA